MPVVRCQICGQEFWRETNEMWKKLCYHCWREKQEHSQVLALRQRLAYLEDDLKYQERTIAYYQEQLAEAESRLAEVDGWLALLRQHNRFLLLACHPDRNPGHAETATAVTQTLLDLRQRAMKPQVI